MNERVAPRFDRSPQKIEGDIPVFLDPERMAALDEYAEGDPYRDEYTADSFWDRYRIEMLVEQARGHTVLDAGCGTGDVAAALSASHAVAAFDGSLSAVLDAAKRVDAVAFAVADATDLPYESGQFDTVVCANLFEHLENPCQLLREAHRVLKPGGRLLLSTPSRYRTRNARRVLRGRDIRFNSPLHVTEYTTGQVHEMLRWCDFEPVAVYSNTRCETAIGTAAARLMQGLARAVGSHERFGDPTIYVARRVEGAVADARA